MCTGPGVLRVNGKVSPTGVSRSTAIAHAPRIAKNAEIISVSNMRSKMAFIRISHSSFYGTTRKGCMRGWLRS
jgi:hypothetical protein